ncbi:MAG: ABC transporter permease [Candidatus Neomarinimicrobiota bacterium]
MLTFRLALKNLIGAGTRTWLNVAVTSLSFVVIVFVSGYYQGFIEYAKNIVIRTEAGGGAYWHPEYDPKDPFTIDDAHGPVPAAIAAQVEAGLAMPVLVIQGAIYPEATGRMMSVLIKGIPPDQAVVDIPSAELSRASEDAIPVLIGTNMARSAQVNMGDRFYIRWRDANGTYDADIGEVTAIMDVENYQIDNGQIWIPLDRLRKLALMPGEATYVATARGTELIEAPADWLTRDITFLIQDVLQAVEADEPYAKFMYAPMLALAAMGIFNSQVLSIFRRRREIGTLMALGMPRGRVIGLFTTEGGLHSLLAIILGAIYGAPLFILTAVKGIPMPYDAAEIGMLFGKRLFPVFPAGLLLGSVILVAGVVTVVSYLPSRRIAKMKPTEALSGRSN